MTNIQQAQEISSVCKAFSLINIVGAVTLFCFGPITFLSGWVILLITGKFWFVIGCVFDIHKVLLEKLTDQETNKGVEESG
jgi:hypothetical protein